MKPTVGRIVHYRLAMTGAVLPMLIVSVLPDDVVNGTVFGEAGGTFPVYGAREGTEPGMWQWPPRV